MLARSGPLHLTGARANVHSEHKNYSFDMVMPGGLVTISDYADHIVDEFLKLLGNILEGQTGPHIDSVVRKLAPLRHAPDWLPRTVFFRKVSGVIIRAQASSS